jgi:hypothetical protein
MAENDPKQTVIKTDVLTPIISKAVIQYAENTVLGLLFIQTIFLYLIKSSI